MFNRIRGFAVLAFVAVGLLVIPAIAGAATTPLQYIDLILMEDTTGERTKLTFYGSVPEGTALPVTTRFSLPIGFEIKMLNEVNVETDEQSEGAQYTMEKSETSVEYTVTLTESTLFVAGFEGEGSPYDRSTEMGGDTPIASMMFKPLDDLEGLVVGFVSPSPDLIGAGTGVELIGKSEDGEIYGVAFQNVKSGEVKNVTVAFASRESRDAALAEAEAEAAAAAEAARRNTFGYWLTTPVGLFTVGGAVLLLAAIVAIIVVAKRQQSGGSASVDDSDDRDEDSDGKS